MAELSTKGTIEDRDDEVSLRSHKKAQNTPSAPLHGSDVGFNGRSSPDDDVISTESQNIPLMRVVMSKKQTKRKSNKVLKEGWVVHYTNQMNMRKKHYWRLDTKSLVMYQDESSTRYFKRLLWSASGSSNSASPIKVQTASFLGWRLDGVFSLLDSQSCNILASSSPKKRG
ncbi:unnamed protein product [Nippostrongylus brasiliensis]|uniref:Protein kinase C n=1 Tax=Nippostrongylus brasiliensis TaxID=27835 RepID=A0A0N4YJ09_NIPBR|nr:unnamed protein product [Nippostrongylus brasiliensis]